MGDARHPRDYNEGPRKEMTLRWKRRVLEVLAGNAASAYRELRVLIRGRVEKKSTIPLTEDGG